MKENKLNIFIKKSKEIHGDKYDYSLVEYINNCTKVNIICPIHGNFKQTPSKHLQGRRCPICFGIPRKTTEQFIKESKEIHGDKYDYSLVEYINIKTIVKIICKEHGVFEQIPHNHLKGNGCPKCSSIKKTTEQFIQECKNIHGSKYDYSLSEYINNCTKVNIICPIHGIFEQSPNSHIINKCGCPKCSIIKNSNKLKKSKTKFIIDSKKIHDNKYDYSLVEYINTKTKIKIICEKHGIFEQSPNSHLQGSGCPICKISSGEKCIKKILDDNNINYNIQKTFEKCKNKNKLPFDFYLPEYNICIEFDGKQHFEPNKYFGGIKTLMSQQINDNIKNKYCELNNIHLIRIKYNENIENKLKDLLKK